MVCYRSVLFTLRARDDGVILISFAVSIRIDYSFSPKEDDISRRNNNNNIIINKEEEENKKYKRRNHHFVLPLS